MLIGVIALTLIATQVRTSTATVGAPLDALLSSVMLAAPPEKSPPDDAEESSDGAEAPVPVPEPEPLADVEVEAIDSTPNDAPAEMQEESAAEADQPAPAETAAPDNDDEDRESTRPSEPEDEDTSAPAPPGGTLHDRLKKAAQPKIRPQPAAFHGLRAGQSTVEELEKSLGEPISVVPQKNMERRHYRIDGTQNVEVRTFRNTVQAIVVRFDPRPKWITVADEIALDKIEPVDVKDEFGERVGMALPEAGVLVVLSAGKEPAVAELVYESVDAQAFTLRAEDRLDTDDSGCQRDLETALAIDPNCARAHWLLARLRRGVGQLDAATKSIETAIKIDPRNPRYRLTASVLYADSGQYDKALDQTKQALALAAARPELKACALNQMGDQLTAGPTADYKRALPLHMEAIKLAEPLAHDRRPVVRRLAQESLIVAHLAAARNIAWGDWKMKKKMVPAWLNRADELATEMSREGATSVDMRLRVCREALAACVGMEGDLDPTPWAEKAVTLSTPLLAEAQDPLRRRQLEWDLGSALYDALQVLHTSGDSEQAMKYGSLAVEHLEAGADGRQLEPVEAYVLGRLYFRMGAVCALHLKDAQQAVTWFERAIPLLERPVPAAAQAEAGRHGESFVSMAVSYWAVGSHEEAVRLTREGLKLMEQAVKDGTLEEGALNVPYTNLATMHRFLGDDEQADAFSEMANKPTDKQRK